MSHPPAGHDQTAMSDMPGNITPPSGAATAIDPVCSMTVTLTPDTRTESFSGKPFHFCSENCQTKFKGDPGWRAQSLDNQKEAVKAIRQAPIYSIKPAFERSVAHGKIAHWDGPR